MVEDSIPPEYLPRADAEPGPVRFPRGPGLTPGRVIAALVAALLLGMAVTLQVQAWRSVAVEAGGRCGTNYGPCPAGTTPILILSFLSLFVLIPAFFYLVGSNLSRGVAGKASTWLAVVALVAGIFPANALWHWAHGGPTTSLSVAWQLPKQNSAQLRGEGSWTQDSSIIRAEVDQVAAYDIASGKNVWTYEVPDPQLLCGMSRDTADGIGVIAYGGEGQTCDTLVGLDLRTGKQLWQQQLVGESLPSTATADFVAVSGDVVAVAASGAADSRGGLEAFDLRTGAPRWQAALANMCSTRTIGAGVTAVVECVDSQTSHLSYSLQAYDPATGKPTWTTPIPYRGSNAGITPLSFAPLVVEVRENSTRGRDQLLSLDDGGHIRTTIDITNANWNTSTGTFAANPVRELAIGDGMIVARATPTGGNDSLVGYSLADGKQAWSQSLRHNDFQAIALDNDRVVVLTERSFRESLTAYDPHTGKSTGLGSNGIDLLTASSSLHVVNGAYAIVVADGQVYPPIVVLR